MALYYSGSEWVRVRIIKRDEELMQYISHILIELYFGQRKVE